MAIAKAILNKAKEQMPDDVVLQAAARHNQVEQCSFDHATRSTLTASLARRAL